MGCSYCPGYAYTRSLVNSKISFCRECYEKHGTRERDAWLLANVRHGYDSRASRNAANAARDTCPVCGGDVDTCGGGRDGKHFIDDERERP